MKSEKLLHIILTVLVAVEGVSMIARHVTERVFFNVIFYVATIIFWILYIAYMVLNRKKDDVSTEIEELNKINVNIEENKEKDKDTEEK